MFSPEKGNDSPPSCRKSLLGDTIRLMKKYGIKPKRRLSQSFVVDENLLRMLVENIQPKPSDVIVEIGAGLGALTLQLAQHGSRVKAVEIDPALVKVLKDRFSHFQNVEVVQGDFMKLYVEGNIFTGNIPYHVSTPIVFKILEQNYDKAVITVQKEVAERIVSEPGSKSYGRLTVSVKARAEPHIAGLFPSSSFYPRPKVSHTILCLRPSKNIENIRVFDTLVRVMFSQRNRLARTVLKNGLKRLYGEKGIQLYSNISQLIPEGKRVFELSVQDFLKLAQLLPNP
jgi:16S rRNA (adenine1518-N6/adenine1519-N6)-dimethyltransferase